MSGVLIDIRKTLKLIHLDWDCHDRPQLKTVVASSYKISFLRIEWSDDDSISLVETIKEINIDIEINILDVFKFSVKIIHIIFTYYLYELKKKL